MATLGVSLHYLYYMGGTLLDSSRNRYLMSAVMANVRKVGRLLLERGTTVEQLVTAPNGVRRCADGSGHAPVSFCLWHFQFYAEPARDLLEWVGFLEICLQNTKTLIETFFFILGRLSYFWYTEQPLSCKEKTTLIWTSPCLTISSSTY
jgi:hypothetical protein